MRRGWLWYCRKECRGRCTTVPDGMVSRVLEGELAIGITGVRANGALGPHMAAEARSRRLN
jgi:hypothetical protein